MSVDLIYCTITDALSTSDTRVVSDSELLPAKPLQLPLLMLRLVFPPMAYTEDDLKAVSTRLNYLGYVDIALGTVDDVFVAVVHKPTTLWIK